MLDTVVHRRMCRDDQLGHDGIDKSASKFICQYALKTTDRDLKALVSFACEVDLL